MIQINDQNMRICYALFRTFVKGCECNFSSFSYRIAPDMEEGQDPNDLDVPYEMWFFENYSEFAEAGPDDGEKIWSGFLGNLSPLIARLKPVEPHERVNVYLYTKAGDPVGPRVSIEGKFRGRIFQIHILSQPPDCSPVSQVIHRDGWIKPKSEES